MQNDIHILVRRLRTNHADKYPSWTIQKEAADRIEALEREADILAGFVCNVDLEPVQLYGHEDVLAIVRRRIDGGDDAE